MSEEKLNELVAKYAIKWGGLYEPGRELTGEDEEELNKRYLIEVLCDALAGIDRAQAQGASKLSDSVRNAFKAETGIDVEAILSDEAVTQYDSEVPETKQSNGERETRGPPERYSLDDYSKEQISNWSKSKKIIIYKDEAQIKTFAERAVKEKNYNQKIYFGIIGHSLAGTIRKAIGYDFEGKNVTLRAENVRKVIKDHGSDVTEKPRGQRAVTPDHFALIPTVISEAESIEKADYKGRPAAAFKKIVDGSRITVLAVDSGGSLELFVQTMYAGIKKGNIAGIPDVKNTSGKTSETSAGTVSDATVPQTESESQDNYSADDKAEENVRKAEEYFGTTYKVNEAGYILLDGKLLDLSGKNNGAPGGYRTVDHRDIPDALGLDYGGDDYSGAMIRFMREGNIRLSPESGGIDLSVKPNEAQMRALDRYISYFRGEVILDIDDENGDTIVSIEYPKRTYSKKIIDAIRAYFDDSVLPEQPEQSTTAMFHDSYSTDDEEYLDAVESGDMARAQEMVDAAARERGYTRPLFHGTPNGTFTVFRDWQYFTEVKSYADIYQNQGASVNYKRTANNPRTYDIDPIKMVEGPGTSGTTTTDATVPQSEGESQDSCRVRGSLLRQKKQPKHGSMPRALMCR